MYFFGVMRMRWGDGLVFGPGQVKHRNVLGESHFGSRSGEELGTMPVQGHALSIVPS